MGKIQELYNTLKSAGADVGTEKEFADWFQAPGQDGYNNRKQLYDTFKSAGADVGDSYEEFASWLNLQPKATQTVDNASKAAPTAKPTQTPQATQQPSTDVPTTTPKSRLEVSTEDDRPSQSYEKTTDPVLRSTTVINPEASQEWEGYKEANPLQAQYIEKSIGADRKLPTFEQYVKADAEAQRKDPIGYAFSKSINEMSSADRAHAYLADQKAEIEKQLNDIAKKRMQDYADSNGAALGMTVQEYLNLDEDYKNLSTALEQAKKSEKVSDNARDARTGDSGFWRGVVDGLTDANAWTMGVLDIQGLMPMMRLKRKLENGEQLTDTEQALAQQMANNTAISEEYADKQGSWYNVGSIASQSLPFMLQFAMTGGGFGTLTRAGTKLGADAARKFTQNALLRDIIKYTGTAVGDIAGAAVMANTVGAANTVNDIFDRYRGTLIQTGDGQYLFAGGKGLGQSIYEGATAQTIEFYTEKLGAHLAITKQASKALGEMGLSKLSTAMSKLGGNKTLSVLGMQDYPSEVLEEEANIILNASFVGDNQFKDLWDSKQQTDLALGMLFSVGGMQAGTTAVNGAYSGAQYQRMKHAMNKWQVRGSGVFNDNAEWARIQNSLDNADNQHIADAVNSILDNGKYTESQKRAIAGYASALVKMRGYNSALMSIVTDPKEPKRDNKLAEEMIGYNANPQQRRELYLEAYGRRKALSRFMDEEQINEIVADPEAYLASGKADAFTADQKAQIDGFAHNQIALNSTRQRIADDTDLEVADFEATVDRMSNDGNIVSGTIRNTGDDPKEKPRKEVVVIKGKVATNDDGSVNVEQSDESLVALVDGKEQMIAPKDLADVKITSAEEQKNLERERISSEYILSQESGMNGMPINKVGNTFKYLDTDGVEHTATIVPTANGQQLPDGQLFVSIDGAEPVAMSQTPLQVGINDYDYAQLQEQKRNKGKQKPTADTTSTDQVATPTEGAEATTDNAAQSQPQYKQGDRVSVNYGGQQYDGTITGEYNDGEKLLVEFEGPDGTRTYPFNMEDVSPIEVVAIPEQTDAASDAQIEAVEPTEEPTTEPTAPAKAIDRIPKDESGQPLYEQSDVATAAEAVLDETEGDSDMASTVVNSMIEDKKKALDKANKAKSKGGNTISEKIASEKERKAAIDKAQSELDFWKGVADELAKRNGTTAENAAPQADTVEETPTADEAVTDAAPTTEGTGVTTATTTTTTPTADTESATGAATDETTTATDEAATDSQEPSSKQTDIAKDTENQAAGGVGSIGIMSEGEKPETDIKTLRKKWAYMRGKMPGDSVFVIEDTDGRLYSFDGDATRINAALNGKGEKAKTDFIKITEQQFKDAAYVLGLKNFRVGLYSVNDINIDDTADTEAKSALDTVKDIIQAVAERRNVDTSNFSELLRGLTDDELNSASRYSDNTKGRSKADKENIGALRRAIADELNERANAADTKAAEQKGYDGTIEFLKNAPNDFDYDNFINSHEQRVATAEANGWPGEAAVQRGVVRAATELKKKSEAANKDAEAQPKDEQSEAKPFHDANRSDEFNELVNLIIGTDELAVIPNVTDDIETQIELNSEKVKRIMRSLNDEEFSALDDFFYGENPLFGEDSLFDITYNEIGEERRLAKAKAEEQTKKQAIYDDEQSRLKHTYDQKQIDALSKAYVDAQKESRKAWRVLTDNKDDGRKDELNSAYDSALSKKSAAEKALKSKLSEYDDKTMVEIGKRDGDISQITSDILRGRAANRELAHEYVNILDTQGEISGKGKPKYRLIDFVDKKSARIPVRGIYHDNGYAIATNLYTLVADKRAYSEADNGKIIDGKGDEIAMEYPAWRKIMPKAIRATGIDAKGLLDFLAGVKEKAKVAKEKYEGCIVMMNIGGTIWATKAEQLEKFAQAALGLGGKIYLQDIVELASSPMHTESANGFAMVMPVPMSASDLRNNPKNVFVYKPTTLGVSEQSKVYKETHPNEVADDTSTETPNENGNTVADTQSAETEAKKDTAKVEAQPEQKDNAVEEIEDVGEKIGGAKKDLAAEAKQRMADDLEKSDSQLASEIELKTLSKIFNFDLPKLRASGMSNEVISFIKICKQMIPAKPRVGYKVRQWVRDTMEVYKLCLNAGTKWEQLSEMLKGKYADSKLAMIYNSYMAVGGFDSGLELNGAYIRQLGADAKMYDNGKEVSLAGKWYVSGAAKHSGTYDTKEAAIEALKAYAGDNAIAKGSGKKQIEFAVYRNTMTGKFFIAPKGKDDIILQDGFKTSIEAFAYIDEHNAEMAERYQTLLSETKVDFNENRERKGRDYRGGKDISAQEFMDTFGFRGVEFGNWTNQKDRANSINECYDALMDLAEVLGVDPKALSLNGTLGMAFGARGGGKFSAHYEPGKVVINLTKTRGAGTLAHEWFHAVDNYFAKMGGAKFGFATSKGGLFPDGITMIPRGKGGYVYYDSKTMRSITEEEYKQRLANHGVRKEIADAWVALMKAINASDYKKRSGAYAYLHSSNYWTEPTELGARAFSKWVENELSKRNATNDYLANNPAIFTESASESTRKYMPYPFDTDAQWMEEAFGNLFSAMEQKTDSESGKVMLYHKADGTVSELTSEEVALRNSIMDLLRNAGIEVIADSKEAQRVLEAYNEGEMRMQKVFHGSGADFDAFDFSHMGEGEGAQAYGWGGYVTEVDGIGRTYARSSSSTKTLNRSKLRHEISFLEESLPFWSGEAKLDGEERLKQLEEELYRLESEPEPVPVLYTVEIPDDNGENYIAWSKGLPKSQRKKIADHLRTLPDSLLDTQRQVHGSNWLPNGWNTLANVIENNPTWGKDIVERLKDAFGSSKEASMTLSDVGFVGISYPAQYRSGGRNDRAKNYVIFNERDMKITDKARFFRTKDGVAYGFTISGKIYIDTSIAKADTPIHEYTHLWASALRESNPKEWANVVSLMKGTPIWDSVRQNYPELTTDDEIADEVLAHYSGQRGAEQLREAQRKAAEESGSVMASANAVSAIERVRKALSKFWKGVADLLNIHFTTAEEVADRVLYDLLRSYKPQSKSDSNVRFEKPESEEGDLLFRQREKPAPKKTIKVYKLMRLGADGKLYPLFIDSAAPIEMRQWYDGDAPDFEMLKKLPSGIHLLNAQTGEYVMDYNTFFNEHKDMFNGGKKGANPSVAAINWATENGYRFINIKETERAQKRYGGENRQYYNFGINGSGSVSEYAMRPGWHAGTHPTMRQIGKGKNKDLRDDSFVWVEGEIAADNDYNAEAQSNPDKDLPGKMPIDGYYLKATNADKKKSQADRVGWYVSGAFKANRIISDAEARSVIDEWNAAHPDKPIEYDYKRESGKEFTEEDARRANEANGVATDNDVVMAVDPVSKVLGSPRGTAQQRKARAERERRRMAETVGQMVEKLQLDNVDVVTDTSTLSGRKAKAKGWYDPKTGRIVVVLPNHSSAMDVAQTVLHEAVAHYGLRRLFGDHFDSFLDTVWLSAKGDVKQRILNLAQRNGWNFRTATEEYLASLAEDTEFDNMNASWWNKIKSLFSEMLDKLGLGELLPMKLSDNELRYILWRSYMNLQGKDVGIMGNAADIGKQMQLGVGNFANTANNDKAADAKPLFRDGTPVTEGATAVRKALVRDKYEQRIKSGWYQTAEAIYDSMQSVKNAMEMVYEAEGEKKPYIEDIPMYENAYIGENVLSSMNKAQADYFANTLFKAMVEEYSKLARTKEERRDLDEYMMAKHGLERNEKMAERDAQRAYDEYKAANPSGTKTLSDFLTAYRQKEYAGLVGLFAKDEQIATALDRMEYLRERLKNVTDPSERAAIRKQIAELRLSNHIRAEKLATDAVELYESENDTADLWEAVRGVTGYTLEKQLSTGLMAADTYNKIKAMYEYYIPLRGFDADVSEDVYAYLGDNGANRNETFVPVAEGRESKADNPLAYMQSMAESAIQSGNRNEMVKQRFLTFVQNHPSDLYSVSEMWLAYNEDTEEWEPVVNEEINTNNSPTTVAAKQQAFEERMANLAESEPDKFRKASQAKDIPYRVLKKKQLKEHQVMVKRNGITYIITVNGNPRLAQAINGMTNPDADISGAVGKIVEFMQKGNRTLSQLYTSRNPNFVVSNFIRDSIYSSTMLLVKESPEYLANFIANVSKYNPWKMSSMFRKWNRGEVDDADMLLFKRFMLNGGETGYTELKAMEERKNDIAKQIKNATGKSRAKLIWEWIATSLDVVGRAVENTNRFGAFVTSLDMGRDVTRAAYDAKEISVNFNRKGSGSKMMGANGQTKLGNTAAFVSGVGRSLYIFWNAAIQGTGNLFKNYRRHPLKATAMTTFWLGLGYLMSAFMMGADGDGDDDDKEKYNGYFNLSQFIRRDNLCISVGGGQYATLPLPIEFRAVYGIGELFGSVTSGKEQLTGDEIAYALFEQVSQVAPIDYSSGGMNAFIPSIVRPLVEVAQNKSWTGLPIAKETPFNKNMPEYTKHYKNTNGILVGFTEQLNHAFGGDKYTRASTEWAEVNPAKVEYLMNAYLGGFFQVVDQTIKTAETVAGTREFDPRSIPLLNRVLKSGDERTAYRKINNDFYKAKEKYGILKGRLSGYKKETLIGDEEYSQKWVNLMSEKEFEEMKVFDVFNKQLNKLYEVRKQMPEGSDEAKEIDTMSQALRIDALQAISDISNE